MEIKAEDYVGDKIEFMNGYGEWSTRKLHKDKKGLYVNYKGDKAYVKPHPQFVVGYRFKRV